MRSFFGEEITNLLSCGGNHVIEQKLNCMHPNPVEAGIVFKAEDCIDSSAWDAAEGIGLLDIVIDRVK